MWKQTLSAYQITDWRMVGHVPKCGAYREFARIDDAIADTDEASRIFLIPGALKSIDEIWRVKHPVLIFGNAHEGLRRLVTPDAQAARIPTPFNTDMFAACCLPLVLHHVR